MHNDTNNIDVVFSSGKLFSKSYRSYNIYGLEIIKIIATVITTVNFTTSELCVNIILRTCVITVS